METNKLRISEEDLIETVLALTPISTIRLTIIVIFCVKTTLGRKYQQ
jgi:hypothetical protein